MTRHVRLRELLIGIEGMALLRRLYDGTDEEAEQRIAEVRRFLAEEAFAAGEATGEADARNGYERWSERYDEPGNPLVALEQPVVWGLLEPIAPGNALDLACGTGRHAAAGRARAPRGRGGPHAADARARRAERAAGELSRGRLLVDP